MACAKKDYAHLKGMEGFSDRALETHFALYEGYVNNANKILTELDRLLAEGKTDTLEYAEFKRRLGWELNGKRLHELYFENLGGDGKIDMSGELHREIERNCGSFEIWQKDFLATGKMRGIGWVILYWDQETGELFNFWINEHDGGHPAGLQPLLVMDVFEHAFFPDYGKDRPSYLEAFMKNINWKEVEDRFA